MINDEYPTWLMTSTPHEEWRVPHMKNDEYHTWRPVQIYDNIWLNYS